MTKGKTICNELKRIRKQIADANEIDYEPRECNHQGECCGTCPACESEVRYIEKQLGIRRQLGKAVVVVGLSAGLIATAGCSSCGGFGVTNGMMERPDFDSTELFTEDTLRKQDLMDKTLKADSLRKEKMTDELDGYISEPFSDETESSEESSSTDKGSNKE